MTERGASRLVQISDESCKALEQDGGRAYSAGFSLQGSMAQSS